MAKIPINRLKFRLRNLEIGNEVFCAIDALIVTRDCEAFLDPAAETIPTTEGRFEWLVVKRCTRFGGGDLWEVTLHSRGLDTAGWEPVSIVPSNALPVHSYQERSLPREDPS